MREDKYLISFNLLVSLAAVLQIASLVGYLPAINITGSLAIATIALIGLIQDQSDNIATQSSYGVQLLFQLD